MTLSYCLSQYGGALVAGCLAAIALAVVGHLAKLQLRDFRRRRAMEAQRERLGLKRASRRERVAESVFQGSAGARVVATGKSPEWTNNLRPHPIRLALEAPLGQRCPARRHAPFRLAPSLPRLGVPRRGI